MAQRPNIPADLKRRVLVEAGHRCAIHTCRHQTTDVHHIIPWERCQEHSYDNLIALCPNCHRRAGSGEIDAKSLRIYKTQLVAALGIKFVDNIYFANNRSKRKVIEQWVSNRIEEVTDKPVPYEVTLEFPTFLPDEGELAELNFLIEAFSRTQLHAFRRYSLSEPPPSDTPWASFPNSITESFKVSLYTNDFIGLKYSSSTYGSGAAHPNHYTKTMNYQRNPLIPLELPDIFRDSIAGVKIISELCKKDLAIQKGLKEADDWIIQGAGPDSNYLRIYNITESGLLFTFDPYCVGSYAQGIYNVDIHYDKIRDVINPRTKLLKLWKLS